jgi:hypothetical protein
MILSCLLLASASATALSADPCTERFPEDRCAQIKDWSPDNNNNDRASCYLAYGGEIDLWSARTAGCPRYTPPVPGLVIEIIVRRYEP